MANIVPTPRPATREIGVESNLRYGTTVPALGMGWGHFIQEGEHVPELQWPQSILWYEQMLYADSMINQMWLSLVMPLSEYVWAINPNGADEGLTAKLAADLGLPVGLPTQDDEDGYTIQPGLFTFNFLQHVEEALLAIPFGHYFFEKVGTIADDGLFHLRQLAARHPATIMEMFIDESGALLSVRQYTGRDGGVQPEPIPADHLVPYVWRGDARARWIGRSMLRPIYRNWLIRDILIRVDAINHERAGGVPGIETDETFQGTSVQDLQALAASFRVGEESGYALPPGAKLVLNKLGGTDVVASLKYHDDQIAGQWRSMVERLGQTAQGNRALGETYEGRQDLAQRAIARWFAAMFRESVIRYWWEQNVPTAADGTLPVHPLLAWRPPKGSTTDPVAPAVPQAAPPPSAEEGGPAPPPVAAAGREPSPRRSIGGAAYEAALGQGGRGGVGGGSGPSGGVPAPGSARAAGPEAAREAVASSSAAAAAVVPQGSAPPASAVAAPQEDGAQGTDALPPLNLPAREMRRQPYEHELRARTDYAVLELRHDSAEQEALAIVTSDWLPALKAELAEKIAVLGESPSPAKLAALSLTPPDAEKLHDVLHAAAVAAADDAGAELAAQSIEVAEARAASLAALIRGQADAMARQVAAGVALAGTRKAIQLATPATSSADLVSGVAAYMQGLAHRWEQDQIRGAVSQAVNAGRFARFQQITKPATYYASELLDDATCDECAAIDGTEYATLDEAMGDYPGGGYSDCAGGPRCRGTVVAVAGGEV